MAKHVWTAGELITAEKMNDLENRVENASGGGGAVDDVKVNGTSVVSGGVANIPLASTSVPGAVTIGTGLRVSDDKLTIDPPSAALVKSATSDSRALTLNRQHNAVFYGLAKAAGDTTQSASSNAVGEYTTSAASAIFSMLNFPVNIYGTDITILMQPGIQYICMDDPTELELTPANDSSVLFRSGSTPTVLSIATSIPIAWPEWFDPTALEANRIYMVYFVTPSFPLVVSWPYPQFSQNIENPT